MSMLVVSAALFCAGLYGVLTRRDIVALLASVEVMLGGALVLLVGMGALRWGSDARIEAVGVLVLVVAAAEAALGLALLVAAARALGATRVDDAREVRG